MTPEEIFAEIARLLNLILEAEGDYDFGYDTGAMYPTYLLGRGVGDFGTPEAVAHIKYDPEEDRYVWNEGDPDV